MKYFLTFISCLTVAVSIGARVVDHQPMRNLPRLFLWAWERPEDLRTLPHDVGVAYLAATLRVKGDRVIVLPRMQPLLAPEDTAMISVFRIEVNERSRPELSDDIADKIRKSIARFANLSKVRAVQIDFDARLDERPFYRGLLAKLRQALPANYPLSITALASWCMCDNWMQKLPIDESVAMLFSMGRDTHNILFDIQSGRRFGDERCDRSLGISLDEQAVNAVVLPGARRRNLGQPIRLYIFSPRKWTAKSIDQALRLAGGE